VFISAADSNAAVFKSRKLQTTILISSLRQDEIRAPLARARINFTLTVINGNPTRNGDASRREKPFFAYFLLALAQKVRRLSRRVSTVLIALFSEIPNRPSVLAPTGDWLSLLV